MAQGILEITKANFEAEVLQSDKTVLLDFWASWCGPCMMLSPIVEEIAKENPQIKVCKVNVDDEPELAQKFQIVSIPALFVVKDKKIKNQAVGLRPKADILKMIE